MSAGQEREARLAAQLRANLKKRKEQARAIPGSPANPPSAPLPGPADDPVTR